MNRDQLIAAAREYLEPNDIWPNALIFEDQWEVQQYAINELDMLEVPETPSERAELFYELWADMDPLERIKALDLDDPYCANELVALGGWTLGADQATIDYQHDTQGHTGAVQWCKEGLCSTDF